MSHDEELICKLFHIPWVPGFAGVEDELSSGSEEGSKKFVFMFVLYESWAVSSDRFSKLSLFCLLVSRRSFPKKAS